MDNFLILDDQIKELFFSFKEAYFLIDFLIGATV